MLDQGTVAPLTTAQRKRLKPSQFGLPERARTPRQRAQSGNYPEENKAHAANAKARALKEYRAGRLSRSQYERIVAKADRVEYAGHSPKHGHVLVVRSSPGRGKVKPDGQPSYKMQARIPRRPRATSRQKKP
jgi:hypothetical protein